VVGARLHAEMVDIGGEEERAQFGGALAGGVLPYVANVCVGGIEEEALASFGVFEGDQTAIGQTLFAGIEDGEGDDVMTAAYDLQSALEAAILEVRKEEYERAAALHFREEFEGYGDARAGGLRTEGEEFADEAEHVCGAAAGRYVEVDCLREEDEADGILIVDGGEGEGGAEFAEHVALRLRALNPIGARAIHDEDHGLIALFREAFEMDTSGAGGDVPIDSAGIVSWDVFADFLELDALSLEGAVIGSGEGSSGRFACAQFD